MIQTKNSNGLAKKTKANNLFLFAFTIVTVISMFTVNAFATDLGDKLYSIFNQCYNDVSTIFDIAAILALGVCLLTLLFGRGSKSAEKSYDWLKTIIICFIIFHFLGTLIPWLTGLFGDGYAVASATIGTLFV